MKIRSLGQKRAKASRTPYSAPDAPTTAAYGANANESSAPNVPLTM